VYRQPYRVGNILSDNRADKKLLAWSKVKPSSIYLTTRFESQLYGGHTGIYVVDFASGTEAILSHEIEQVLAISSDETKIAYTPNDQTCCMGSNYTNNTVIIWNAVSKKSVTVYDEWGEFGNEGKEDEHTPDSAFFSPDGNLIAISIDSNASIRKADGSGIILTIKDRFAVGWLDQDHLILGTWGKYDGRLIKVQDMSIYELKSGKEESLSLNNVNYIAFK
jgi:WD40 repeat protein